MAWIRTSLSLIDFAEVYAAALSRSASEIVEHRGESLSNVLLTSSAEPVAVLDRRGTVLLVNAAWRKRARNAAAPLLAGVMAGSDYLDVCRRAADGSPTQLGAVPAALDAVLGGRQDALRLEYRSSAASGEGWHELVAEPLPSAATGALILHRDLSRPKEGTPQDRPHSESEAPVGQRPEQHEGEGSGAQALSLGELAAALAHELSQPLAAIRCNSQAARRLLAADNPDLEEIRLILDDISADDTRAVKVLTRIRALINREEPDFHPVKVDALVRSLARQMREEAQSSGVRISLDLNAARLRVCGDAVQLEQALSNLIRNAIQALDASAPDERRLTIRTAVGDAQTIEVAVQDRGVGVPEDLLGHIFQPFYSTKPTGMGIGLAIARSTIEMHGGRLWVTNNADRGATFRFTLPVLTEGSP